MKDKKLGKWSIVVVFCAVLIAFGASFNGKAFAKYPEKPITLLVAFAAGGSMDMCNRALAAVAEKYLGQPIVVENRGGGGGTVALAVVVNAKRDRHTRCGATSTGIVRIPQFRKVPFKPLKSFTPIMAYGFPQSALVVRKDAPWKTFKEFIEYAKAHPGRIKYSTTGVGTPMHRAMEYIAKREGIKWVHIPYKGSAPAMTALLGGHVDACSSGPIFITHAKSGTVRILATHGEKRMAAFPDVPTLKELGYDFVNRTVFSIVGPAGLPPEVVKKLEDAFKKAAESKEFKAVLDKLYLAPTFMDSKTYAEFLKSEWDRIGKMLMDLGLIKKAATPPY